MKTNPEPVCWTVCEPGGDHSCNDNPIISAILGTCLADGTCSCDGTSTINPETGRCM